MFCDIDSRTEKIRFAVVQPTVMPVPGISTGPRFSGTGPRPASRPAHVTALTGTIA